MTRRKQRERQVSDEKLDERLYAWAIEQEQTRPPHAVSILGAVKYLGVSETAAKQAILRLEQRGRLRRINPAGVWEPIGAR